MGEGTGGGNETGKQDTAERMILSSQIHMTNNRLGIVPQLEAPLAEVLQVCGGS